MIDERDRLVRTAEHFDPPTDALARLLRRKVRRERNRRVAAGVVAATIAVTVLGALATTIVRDDGAAPGGASVLSPDPTIAYGAFVPVDATFTSRTPGAHGNLVSADLRGIAAAAPGFVAIGDTSRGDDTDPVWFSANGIDWSRAPVATGPRSGSLWDVIAGGPGFVVVGIDTVGSPAAWTSADGTTWTRASVMLPDGIGDVDAMFGLTQVPGGLMAWGRVHGGDAYVWMSVDGTDWRPIADEASFGGNGEQSIMRIEESPAGFVALGSERPDGSTANGHAVVWTSPDGQTWTKDFPIGPEPLGDWWSWGLQPLTSTDGFLFGSALGMFASTDGVIWERREPPPEVGAPLVAEGKSGTTLVSVAADGTIWTSADGGPWVDAGTGAPTSGSPAFGPQGLLALGDPDGNDAMTFAPALG